MLAWLLLFSAFFLCTLGLLTAFPSPPWSPWKLAVLAGEFGHWLALPAGAVLVTAALAARDGSLIAAPAALIALIATVFLLKPTVQAHRVASALPTALAHRFGARAQPLPSPRAFSPARLFIGRDPAPVAPRTFTIDGGLPLDFYPAIGRNGAGPAPVVIVIHGGGWDSGDRHQLPKLNHLLAARGFAVAAISYRLAPHALWPAQRDDTLAAIAWLKAQAPALDLDAQRLVLLGRSAGGQIAQTVAYTARDPAIRGVVALYAPSDLIFGYENTHEDDMLRSPALMRQFLGGTPESARANYESASALFHVHPAAPPTLLLHGINDALAWHRHSARLEARLAAAGVPHCYVALPWATHAFDFNLHGPGGQLTVFALDWFLDRVTAG
jgi:acetyl esterase/lipase